MFVRRTVNDLPGGGLHDPVVLAARCAVVLPLIVAHPPIPVEDFIIRVAIVSSGVGCPKMLLTTRTAVRVNITTSATATLFDQTRGGVAVWTRPLQLQYFFFLTTSLIGRHLLCALLCFVFLQRGLILGMVVDVFTFV